MSRIGNKPIPIPSGVDIKIEKNLISVKGPKGSLEEKINSENITFEIDGSNFLVSRTNEEIEIKSMHGLYRSLISNMVEGVTNGFNKKLQLIGTGYRAQPKGKSLELSLGFSHPITVDPIGENKLTVNEQTSVIIDGIDKEHVGRQAAKIRSLRKPNPFTGKGIKYSDEIIRRKSGKSAVGSGGTE
jgi:large subunit ribosomal protein L6|tara:strand:- start:17246 stop:17803 length:558 start_codon:yes stop_codon:yes gene_type:complete